MAITYETIRAGTTISDADTGSQFAAKINANFASTKDAIENIEPSKPEIISIILNQNSWDISKKTLTVSNSKITSNNCNTYTPLLPDAESTSSNILTSNYDLYISCGIRAIYEGIGSVVFKADTIPTANIAVNVKIDLL